MSITTTSAPRRLADPQLILRKTKIQYRAEGCKLGAMILLVEPEMLGEKTIGAFLMEIPFMTEEIAGPWLAAAGVNPWRKGSKLTGLQKDSLARSLTGFWKTWKAGQS